MADDTKTNGSVKLDPSKPILQPAGYDENSPIHRYETSEILWWDNGVWGKAGYAIPNDGGKPTTPNETIHFVHKFIGAEMFNLMHRDDVKFSRPFNAEWLFDLNKMLTLGIKRLSDYSVSWSDKRKGDAEHATNTPRAFTVYPIPFFGERIRQQDALRWAGQVLLVLSEVMQHSDNDFDDDVTDLFVAMVQSKLRRIQQDMAMKYLGFTREQVEAADFVIPDTAFAKGSYDPSALFTSREMIEERMPEQWWPSTNDLTPIAGVASTVANVFAKRWPIADGFYGDGGASESTNPGGGSGIVSMPGPRPS
ncbi:hypothetical protein GYB59_00595 [bacterium]|nr:hypothetical protein [bacterium]